MFSKRTYSLDEHILSVYKHGVIQSFRGKETEKVWNEEHSAFAEVQNVSLRKLQMLNAAVSLMDLRVPPGNRLEPLQGRRKGQHSIRINGKWRVCFRWHEGNAHDVEIVDYH